MSRALFNIEVGHVDWTRNDIAASLSESARIGLDFATGQDLDRDDYSTSVLVDDKSFCILDREKWLTDTKSAFPEFFGQVDYIVFESDLGALRDRFLVATQSKYAGATKREMDAYLKKHGVIACSHDIALWHTYRLGLLGDAITPIVRPLELQDRQRRAPFFAQQCVSILEDENKAPEDRARELLKRLSDRTVLDRVEVMYYAV